MKRIALISTLAFLGVGIALWISQSYINRWEPRLRSELAARAGAALGSRVEISDVSIYFLRWVVLRNVEVWDTQANPEALLFRAKEVKITLSLIDLPNALWHRNPLETIGLIEVDTPFLDLSPEWVNRQRHPNQSPKTAKPLWFSLVWNQGTFQWKDPEAPHGAWTLYQTAGRVRILGPHIDAFAQGSLEQVSSVSVQVTEFAQRWTAQVRLLKGDLAGVRTLMEKMTKRQWLPENVILQGHFNLDAKASGRWPIHLTKDVGSFLREARLTLSDVTVVTSSGATPLEINGAAVLKENRVDLTGLSLKSKNISLNLSGHALPFAPIPQIDLDAQGQVGQWPVEKVHAQIRRLQEGWVIDPTTLRIFDGTLTLKGRTAPGVFEIFLTGNELSLQDLTASKLKTALQGRLNFSISTHDLDGWNTVGSFWVTNYSWAHSAPESIRGDVEVTSTHLRLKGVSDDETFRIQAQGSKAAKTYNLDQLSIQLRPDVTITARGAYDPATGRVNLDMDTHRLSLEKDILMNPGSHLVAGHFDGHGKLEGSFPNPTFHATFDSQDFQLHLSTPAEAHAAFTWTPQSITGEVNFGQGTVTSGAVRFRVIEGNLEIPVLSIVSPLAKADLKASGHWEKPANGTSIKKFEIRGGGQISSLDGSLWNFPCRFDGILDPSAGWAGDVHLEAATIQVHGQNSEPFGAQLHWNKEVFAWDALHWGSRLTSNGSVQFGTEHPLIAGQLRAQNLDLVPWQALFWSKTKEPIHGFLSGVFNLSGTLDEPLVQFSGKVQHAFWRAFKFESSLNGTWKKDALEPLSLAGSLASGGQFRFQGRLLPKAQTVSGTLEVVDMSLRPIGESLSFPYPLGGKAKGTFTVSGPLHQLHFVGQLEGTSIQYGDPAAHPIKLESCLVSMKLEPTEEGTAVTRLTFLQAVAKTQEEEIRLAPGSFVEFSGIREARLQIGSEIRNLHLSVFTLFGGLDINGTWQIKPQGFAIQGDLFSRSLYINDYQLEQGHILASYYNHVLTFDPPKDGPALVVGTVDFKNQPQLVFNNFSVTGKGHEGLQLTGTVGPRAWDFKMSGRGLDLSTLGGLAGFPYSLRGNANVNIRGRGDLDHPDVEGTLDVEDGQALSLNFQSGSAAFAWRDQHMTFTRLQLSDPGRYTLTGTGVFPLASKTRKGPVDKTLDFSIRLVDSNLGLLQSLSREVRHAEGSVQALLHMTGTSDAPLLRGSVRVKNGDVEGAHYFRRVKNFQLAAEFKDNDLEIGEFRGESGKGEFIGGGHIVFAGYLPKSYDLHLDIPSAKGIDIVIPELAIPESPLAKKFKFFTTASAGNVRGHAAFRGPEEAPVLSAEAYIRNGHFTFPPSSKNPPPPGFLEWIRRINWDTTMHFSDGAWFDNELVSANLNGSMTIKGTSNKLRVDGGIDISEGRFSYLGVEFDIRQARYDIRTTENDSTLTTTPYVRGIAESLVQTIDPVTGQSVNDTVTLTINYAPVNEIKPQLKSSLDPGLSQDKLFARVTQLELENLNPQERNALYQQQMVRLIDTSLATPLARNLLKRTGLVDEVHVSHAINPTTALANDPNNPASTQRNSAANLLAGTKYTVAKNLTSHLSLGYGLRFEQIQTLDTENKQANKLDLRSDVEMSYRFLSNLFLKGSFDLPTATPGVLPDRRVTLEPRWRFGWWGNTNKSKPKPPKPDANAQTGTNQPAPASN